MSIRFFLNPSVIIQSIERVNELSAENPLEYELTEDKRFLEKVGYPQSR